MSEITGGGSVVHGALVFLAAVVGIAGYLIRSRLNHIELQKKEEAAQEEERRRAALQHCKDQLELFIGPVLTLFDANSSYMRNIWLYQHEQELALSFKKFNNAETSSYFQIINEATVKRLRSNDKDAIYFLENWKIVLDKYLIPANNLIKQYQYSHSEIPTQSEHDEMYPTRKGKKQLSILNLSIAHCDYHKSLLDKWDGHTNIFKDDLFNDLNNPACKWPYCQLLMRWQYDKVAQKREFLFKEDMKRANEMSVKERNKKSHESYIIEVKNDTSGSSSKKAM